MTARSLDIDAWKRLGAAAARASAAKRGHIRGAQGASNRSHRAKQAGATPSPEAHNLRQAPLRPRSTLTFDARVVIRPDRPAPLQHFANGVPMPFQDDLNAIFDHGSPGPAPRPDDAWRSSRVSTLAEAM
jgi:hypothetical protein